MPTLLKNFFKRSLSITFMILFLVIFLFDSLAQEPKHPLINDNSLVVKSSSSTNTSGKRNNNLYPMPSRWMHPDGLPKPEHIVPQKAPRLEIQRVNVPASTEVKPIPPGPNGRLCLIVEDAIYNAIATKLNQYIQDLQIGGYTVLTYRFVSGSAEDLRLYIKGLYDEPESLVSAQLIGNIPYIIYEMMQNWGGGGGDEYEDFPCDLFYMDLNGVWSDSLTNGLVQPSNGKYDTRSGDTAAEIWVSRLKTDNLSGLGSATDILNYYFDKNHAYRIATLRPTAQALVYNDDDWDYMGTGDQSIVELVYGLGSVALVNDAETTTASDYMTNHMPVNQELIFTRSHGYPGGHGYYRNSKANFDYVFNSNYRSILPPALFYQLFVCSGADYTASDYLAGTIAFNNGNVGLLAWGSTKTGGMWDENTFYTQLGLGYSFGKAFIDWYNAVGNYSYAPEWWYGMVLIGDASLYTSPQFPGIEDWLWY